MADPIADLRSETGSLVSVYVRRPSPGGFAALLSDLLRPIRELSDAKDRPVAKALRGDADRIHHLAANFELESAPGYAIFASELDGLLVVEPLAHEVPDVAMLGPRPYLRPLRAAPRPLRAGVLVADRVQARIFTAFGGSVEEVGERLEAETVKPNYGGFSGYDEHVVRGRASEASQKMWKDAGQRLLDFHQQKAFDYLVIAGHEEMFEEIARSLHPYLTRLQRVTFTTSPGTLTPQTLRTEMEGFDEEMLQEREAALAGRVCDTAWSGGNGVLGLSAVLEAVNVQAVDTLVVAGEFRRDGIVCGGCGYLDRTADLCPVCGAETFVIVDVVAAAMEAAVASGGRVHQIQVASPLDSEGVGALIRFPIQV